MSLRKPPPGRPPGRPRKPAEAPDAPIGVEKVQVGGKQRTVIPGDPALDTLPPAGYQREELLKMRKDDLDERLAKIEAALGIDNSAGPQVDLAQVKIENEIAAKIDITNVPDALPEFHYYWANFSSQHGIDVTLHQAMGYEVVRGDMPEATASRDELGRRKVGDTILMRTPLDNYLRILQLDRTKRAMRENPEAFAAALEDIGRKAGGRIQVRRELNDYQTQRAMRRAQAQQIARQRFNEMLRGGAVPGLPVGS